jgi:hypothetical protein
MLVRSLKHLGSLIDASASADCDDRTPLTQRVAPSLTKDRKPGPGRFVRLPPDTHCSLNLTVPAQLLERASRKRFGRAKAEALQRTACESLGLAALGPAAQLEIGALLDQIVLLEQQVHSVDEAIAELLAGIEQHVASIPGIGPVLAATIVADIGDIDRFPRLEALVAYAGIDPSIFASGQFEGRRQHISKRGSPYLCRALFLATHNVSATTPTSAPTSSASSMKAKPTKPRATG